MTNLTKREALIYALGEFLHNPELGEYDDEGYWLIDLVKDIEKTEQLCQWCEKHHAIYEFKSGFETPDLICQHCYLDYAIGAMQEEGSE